MPWHPYVSSPPIANQEIKTTTMKTKNPLRVLLVDDDVLISHVVRDLLETAGHTMIGAARDGRQAIEMVKALKPDMVFMDIEMPEMNGLEATRQIRDQCPVPVVLLTAHDDPELVEEGSAAGAAAYLVKPPNPGEMARTMAVARARFADFMLIQQANEELKKCLRDIKVLRGLLPICNCCQRIRDAAGHWQRVDVFLSAHTNLYFVQTVCETCRPLLPSDRPTLPPQPTAT